MFRKRWLLVLLLLTVLAACSQAPAPEAEVPLEIPALPPGVRVPWDDTPPDLDELAPMFGGVSFEDARGLAKHSGGVYVVGQTYSNLHDTHKGKGDIYIRRYDVNGSLLWGRQFGTAEYESVSGVAADAFNYAYVVGTTLGNLAGKNAGSYDAFIRKYTPSGNVAWTRQFGASGQDWALSVAADVSGNAYVVGIHAGRYFLKKYGSDGTRIWTYHAPTGQVWRDVAVDANGNIYVAGTGSAGMMLRKFSPGGGAYWTQEVPHFYQGHGTAVAVSGPHVYLVGNFTDQNSVLAAANKFNTDGVRQWNRAYSLPLYYVYDASANDNGDLYFTGMQYTQAPKPGWIGVITKASATDYGQELWNHHIDTFTSGQGAFSFAVVARGTQEVYAAGYTNGHVGAGNQGAADAYLRRLDAYYGYTVWTR